jgi:hypothetical protein
VVLPDSFRTVSDALEAAGAGDRIFFREGSFTWEHVAMVCERIQISGDDKSCLLGAWLLQADTAGLFQGVCCASKHHNEPAAVLPHATITSFSASWIFEDCELRAVRAPVFRLFDEANSTLLSCNIGGVGTGDASADEDLLLASDAVVAMSSSNVLLYRCRIEDTGDADTRPPRDLQGNIIEFPSSAGPAGLKLDLLLGTSGADAQEPARNKHEFPLYGGVRLFDSAKARLEQCTATNNDVVLTLSGAASAFVRRCDLASGKDKFAILRAVRCAPKSRLLLRKNHMQGLSSHPGPPSHLPTRAPCSRPVNHHVHDDQHSTTKSAVMRMLSNTQHHVHTTKGVVIQQRVLSCA